MAQYKRQKTLKMKKIKFKISLRTLLATIILLILILFALAGYVKAMNATALEQQSNEVIINSKGAIKTLQQAINANDFKGPIGDMGPIGPQGPQGAQGPSGGCCPCGGGGGS
jgi:hypothetical protein